MPQAGAATRAAREALLAQLFADLDALLQRVESLPALLDAAGLRMDSSAETIGHHCDQLVSLTDDLRQATREDLSALLRRRADEAAATAAACAGEQLRQVVAGAMAEALREQVTQLTARIERERLMDRARWRITMTVMGLFTVATLASTAWSILAR